MTTYVLKQIKVYITDYMGITATHFVSASEPPLSYGNSLALQESYYLGT